MNWIKEIKTAEDILKDNLAKELEIKINEANSYLSQTDWANAYKIRHDLGLELIPGDSSKWETIAKREKYITFLRGL